MTTGVVMAISQSKATIMQAGGVFVDVRAEAAWQVGDVVTISRRKAPVKLLSSAMAAVIVLFCLGF